VVEVRQRVAGVGGRRGVDGVAGLGEVLGRVDGLVILDRQPVQQQPAPRSAGS
jgi:hypothetical protein